MLKAQLHFCDFVRSSSSLVKNRKRI